MTESRFLVTGALGCLGAWTVRRLLAEDVPVWTYDLPGRQDRLKLVIDDQQLRRLNMIDGDITDLEGLESAVVDNQITHIVHLAALQVPFVRADPVQGARANVVGTTILFEVVKRHANQIKGTVYASSAGVWGPAHAYPPGPLADDAVPLPGTLYGVFKLANEGTARIYWEEHRIPSIGLRPFVVYGPGRDQGMTSSPSKAMLAAAVGRPYQISFGERAGLEFADDVAAVFIRAARNCHEGAGVFDLGGSSAGVDTIISAIETVVPEMRGKITHTREPWSNIVTSKRRLESAIGPVNWTPLEQGVRRSIEIFRQGVSKKLVDVDRILGPEVRQKSSASGS